MAATAACRKGHHIMTKMVKPPKDAEQHLRAARPREKCYWYMANSQLSTGNYLIHIQL